MFSQRALHTQCSVHALCVVAFLPPTHLSHTDLTYRCASRGQGAPGLCDPPRGRCRDHCAPDVRDREGEKRLNRCLLGESQWYTYGRRSSPMRMYSHRQQYSALNILLDMQIISAQVFTMVRQVFLKVRLMCSWLPYGCRLRPKTSTICFG